MAAPTILVDNEVALAGPAFDRPAEPLRRLVVIAAAARAGGHLLCRLLRQAGYGVGIEYHNPLYQAGLARRWGVDPADPGAYLDAVIRHRTAGGVAAIKCLPVQFGRLMTGIAARGGLGVPITILHLWRRDSLAQAISLRLAHQSGFWNFTAEPTTPALPGLDVSDLDALDQTRQRLIADERWWRTALAGGGFAVIHLRYEDLIRDRAGTLAAVIEAIDPARAGAPLSDLPEPPTPAGLWARQSLGAEERQALTRAYEARFGPVTPLADP